MMTDFKKNEKVRFVEAGTDFLTPDQDIKWRYGSIIVKINKRYGSTAYLIEEENNKNKLKISEYLVFKVH
jgi:hypothetical protein